jgi:glycine dehydrogenase
MLRISTTDSYIKRHIGNDAQETKQILETLKVKSVDQLIAQTVPDAIRIDDAKMFQHKGRTFQGLDSESGVLKLMAELGAKNRVFKSY